MDGKRQPYLHNNGCEHRGQRGRQTGPAEHRGDTAEVILGKNRRELPIDQVPRPHRDQLGDEHHNQSESEHGQRGIADGAKSAAEHIANRQRSRLDDAGLGEPSARFRRCLLRKELHGVVAGPVPAGGCHRSSKVRITGQLRGRNRLGSTAAQ